VSQPDDARCNDVVFAAFGKALNERTVNLDLVDGESLKVCQRCVAGPEIVDRESHSGSVEALQLALGGRARLDQNRFRQHKEQPRGA
jgi:hypothetical protein